MTANAIKATKIFAGVKGSGTGISAVYRGSLHAIDAADRQPGELVEVEERGGRWVPVGRLWWNDIPDEARSLIRSEYLRRIDDAQRIGRRRVMTCESNWEARSKSVTVTIHDVDAGYRLQVTTRSGWVGEPREEVTIDPATYETLDAARVEAEARADSPFGDPRWF